MKRFLTITAIVFAIMATAIATLWVGVFRTGPGRAFLTSTIEDQLGDALNSEAEIGALKGAPPGYIILEDITLNDAQGAWAKAKRLEVRWRPLALLRKRIYIDEANLESFYLFRDPPPDDEDKEESNQIDLSIDAPNLFIADLALTDFRAEVNGELERLDGAGNIRLNGPDIDLRLALTSGGGRDQADITFEKAPRSDRFFLDATLVAETGGVIASLLDLKGPLRIDAKGAGGVASARVNLTGRIGAYGDVEAVLASDLSEFTGADLNIDFTAGERLSHIPELAAPAAIDARLNVDRRGGGLLIHTLTSAIGSISGEIKWRAPGGAVERMTSALDVQLADDYQREIQKYAGQNLKVVGQFDWRREDYALSANIDGERANIEIRNGETDLDRKFSGSVAATFAGHESLPAIIVEGAAVNGDIDIDLDRSARIERLVIVTEDGSEFHGRGQYRISNKSADLTGDFILSAATLSRLAPNVTTSEAIRGDVDLEGPIGRFTLQTNFETPELKFEDGALPPMTVKAALAGLPRLPSGDVTATARNGAPRRFEAQLRASEDGKIRAPKVLYAGRGFKVDGAGDFDPSTQTANIDLSYNGEREAMPWPGFVIAGDGTVNGVLSREGALNNLNIEASALSVNDFSVAGFAMAAQGPPGAVNIEITGDSFAAPGVREIIDYAAEAQVNMQGAPRITLSRFEALIADNRTRLTQAAQIDLNAGVTVSNLRLAYGANGSIALDGAFNPARWRADAALRNINIPNADGQITMDFNLDTDAETPGRADFTLRSLLLNKEEASVAGAMTWDGNQLVLIDDGADKKLDMRIVLPLILTKTPKITVNMEGALGGFIRYNGDVQAIAAYLPPTLQTMEGKLAADFNIGGETSAPDLSGSAKLTDGAYTELGSGFSLANLHAEAEAVYEGGKSAIVFSGGARGADQSREDTITFTGDMTIGGDTSVNLAVKLDDAVLSAHPVNSVRANGSINIFGPFNALEANGDIVIEELDAEIITPESTGLVDIDVVSYNEAQTATDKSPDKRNSGLKYSIKLAADDRIFIRGRGLESEWSANATVVNGREEPIVVGDLSLRRGWLDFSGRRFDLTRGLIKFDLLSINNPVLDIRAEHETGEGVVAAIVISGRAQEPEVSLESTPSLPQEDVMSLILFGKPAQELSPFESLQIAEALASLSGVGPFGGEGVTGRLRNAVGLDLLNVDIDPENGGGSLTVGKYVADGFFVSASQDAEGKNGSVRVKYEITDNITVETELEQNGDQTVSANWKRDF